MPDEILKPTDKCIALGGDQNGLFVYFDRPSYMGADQDAKRFVDAIFDIDDDWKCDRYHKVWKRAKELYDIECLKTSGKDFKLIRGMLMDVWNFINTEQRNKRLKRERAEKLQFGRDVIQQAKMLAGTERGKSSPCTTVAAAGDLKSRLVATGHSGVFERIGQLHPTLQSRIRSHGEKVEVWNIANCAEVEAANKLVIRGATPTDLVFYAVNVRTGLQTVPCETCRGWIVPGNTVGGWQ